MTALPVRPDATAAPDPVELTIIVVAFHSDPALLDDALRSAVHAASRAGLACEIVIVDNSQNDPPRLPPLAVPVRVLPMGRNAGFGAAVNAGVVAARGTRLYCVNPDTHTSGPALELLDARLSQPGKRMLSGWLTNHGRPQTDATLLWFCSTSRLLRRRGHARRLALCSGTAPVTVAKVCGGALYAYRQDLLAFPFDEAFFLYGEDVDLSVRARAAGFALETIPDAGVTHAAGTSARTHGLLVERARTDAALRLVAHHHRWLLLPAVLELYLVTVAGLLAARLTSSGSGGVRRARLTELRRWVRLAVPPPFTPPTAPTTRTETLDD